MHPLCGFQFVNFALRQPIIPNSPLCATKKNHKLFGSEGTASVSIFQMRSPES